MAAAAQQLKQQLKNALTVFLLWCSFRQFDRICESESNFFNISQILILAGVAVTAALKINVGMGFITAEALLRIITVPACWKRAVLKGMLLLGIVGFSRAYFYIAFPVFQEWYRYLTLCAPNVGYPSLIAMELTLSMAFLPMYAWVAVSKNHHWLP